MTDYGFETSDEIELDKPGFPLGTFKIMCLDEEDNDNGEGFIALYEIVSGEHKSKQVKVWYNVHHIKTADEKYDMANIAKQQLKRIGDACGKAISKAAPLKGRVFTVEVTKNKKGYNNVSRYYSEDYTPEAKAPF